MRKIEGVRRDALSLPGRVLPRLLVEELEASFLDYSMSVIVRRALPDARDGLKPVHRRILYAMYGLGLGPRQAYKKSATVVGEVLGKYHPHGDSAVYAAMVRLAQDFSTAHPLVDGQGNFGSVDGDNAAAYRYTEARLSEVAVAMLEDIDRDTVDFRDNYDGRHREPEVLPARLPNLLVNGSEGIAVGMATRVPPHNLREIGAAIALLCDRPDAAADEVGSLIKGPDFPTGGLVIRGAGVEGFKKTGRGLIRIRASAHVEQSRDGGLSIVFSDTPYGVAKADILERIAGLVRDSRGEKRGAERKRRRHKTPLEPWGEWIADLRDESDREGIRMVVGLKRGVAPDMVLARLYARTPLETTYGAQLLALVDGAPRLLSIHEALRIFIKHRLDVVVRRARHDLNRARERAHVLEGLLVAIDGIDRVVQIIRTSRKRETAATKLRKAFSLSDRQANAILNLRMAQLTALDVSGLKDELAVQRKLIRSLDALLADPVAQRNVVKEETLELVERFGRPRRSRLVRAVEADVLVQRAAEESYEVCISSMGRVQVRPEGRRRPRQREGEVPLIRLLARGGERAVLFTAGGSAFSLIPEGFSQVGSVTRGVPGMRPGEQVLWAADPRAIPSDGSVVFVSEQGYIKRTPFSEYVAPRAGGIVAVKVAEGDRLVRVMPVLDEQEILIATAKGKAIRFPVADVPVQGRAARGVIGIKLAREDRVVSAGALVEQVLVITALGYGKRVMADAFPLQRRAGQGVILHRLSDKTGPIICGLAITAEQHVALLWEDRAIAMDPARFDLADRTARGEHGDVPFGPGVRFVIPILPTAAP